MIFANNIIEILLMTIVYVKIVIGYDKKGYITITIGCFYIPIGYIKTVIEYIKTPLEYVNICRYRIC